ncbi:hypothetical protein CTheo_4471 [Ceratobasidium theobromae]|uniref:Uncharacterized protein n=1 Tax=Ceratobasidium theobromae TaxID=1582974 RepID=A0A5N5QKC3_9AGAM|nr:hypothetical protein CTheo_4471 [Ceratobasidium theobromae]
MRRIVSALGLNKKERRLRCESTPALVHAADSASSSGIRTPSDDADTAAIASPSSDSVHTSRWLGLLRALSRKRRTEDDDSDSSTHSRPRSPPMSPISPPAPPFVARRASSPASSVYRGPAHVPRAAPSRANLALHALTQPLVLAAGAPSPHPLRAPDPSSPLCYPRSVARYPVSPAPLLRIHVHRARILRRLETGSLTAAEEASILPFATRPAPRAPLRRPRPSPTDDAAELGAHTGRWSRGLRRWVARPVFEDRNSVYTPVGPDIVRPARGLGTETLDFSDATLAMAGLAIDTETDDSDDDSQRASAIITPQSGNPPLAGLTAQRPEDPRTPESSKAPIVRGVRFADDDDATDGDDLPLAVLASVQKKRAEKQARARHDRYVERAALGTEPRSDRQRLFADEFARARALQDVARAGVDRPASLLRDSDPRRRPPASALSTVQENTTFTKGHSRSSSGSSTSTKPRIPDPNPQITSPVKNRFSASVISPTSPTPAPSGFPIGGLASSAPSSLASFPPNFGSAMPSPPVSPFPHSNSLPIPRLPHSPARSSTALPSGPLVPPAPPFASRSLSGSPLRSSFALPPTQDEFGLAANPRSGSSSGTTRGSGSRPNATANLQAIMAQNQALMAQNQMLTNMMFGSNAAAMAAMNGQDPALMGPPNPPFAHSRGSSASGSRGHSPARSSGSSKQSSVRGRPSPTPIQPGHGERRGSMLADRKDVPSPAKPGHAKSASQSTKKSGHAYSKSEHSVSSQRMSRTGSGGPAVPPIPAVPTGVYSMRGRTRPAGEVVT